jgi:pyrophosphatase PpaX
MPHLSTYLFDLDGTLLDSLELILDSYRHTLTVHRGVAPADEVWIAGIGTPLRKQLEPFVENAEELERFVDTYREHNFAHHDAMIRSFPGIRDVVESIKSDGKGLGIVTSKARKGTAKGLKIGGLEGLFDVIVAADDVEKHKPDPTPVLKALDLLNADAEHTVFIGDSPHDMAAGRSAAVLIAAALWGPFDRDTLALHSPDYWLSEPSDILSLDGR